MTEANTVLTANDYETQFDELLSYSVSLSKTNNAYINRAFHDIDSEDFFNNVAVLHKLITEMNNLRIHWEHAEHREYQEVHGKRCKQLSEMQAEINSLKVERVINSLTVKEKQVFDILAVNMLGNGPTSYSLDHVTNVINLAKKGAEEKRSECIQPTEPVTSGMQPKLFDQTTIVVQSDNSSCHIRQPSGWVVGKIVTLETPSVFPTKCVLLVYSQKTDLRLN